jgi:dihydropteroate synthase
VDPGIGFFRRQHLPWSEWDTAVLANLRALSALGRPLCVGVSRKSFIGAILGQDDPRDRLPGSLAAAALAVVNGAHLIRTHDVAETRQAVRVAEAIRDLQR